MGTCQGPGVSAPEIVSWPDQFKLTKHILLSVFKAMSTVSTPPPSPTKQKVINA